ncbi:plant-expansin-like protein [Pleurotus ostreatus PC15]|uniref:Plant-expansin-like protein n=1 Tax=Pleurotus ostreatus (strain PC15) TaxID=1137138 RepID=A0A067NU97_PLEO1|nr:plant-expansin-like protein [Pleurotus ostreatus PC15]
MPKATQNIHGAMMPIYFLLILGVVTSAQWIDYPANGFATMTHYTLPRDYVAACGCTPSSTHYPTAALSQMAFGSSAAYGPGCGRCFKLTLLNTFLSDPPFYPTESKSITVKITDLCPLGGDWCSATTNKPNKAGLSLNFDLAFPSSSIPDDFFPSNEAFYGYTDFGVWNTSYQVVPCNENWPGSRNQAALGSVANQGPESVCCPAEPTGNSNDTCTSYSDKNGLPPDTRTNGSEAIYTPRLLLYRVLLLSLLYLLACIMSV